jgi:hypothetical protein
VNFNQQLIDYLPNCPDTATIAVPSERLSEAGSVPGVSVVGHDAYYSEYLDANGICLARVVFAE